MFPNSQKSIEGKLDEVNRKIENLTACILSINDDVLYLKQNFDNREIHNEIKKLNSKFESIIIDVDRLKQEGKLIAAWQDAKKRNNMSGPETWYELTKCMNEYFAEQLNVTNMQRVN